jgi:hypothetical protein
MPASKPRWSRIRCDLRIPWVALPRWADGRCQAGRPSRDQASRGRPSPPDRSARWFRRRAGSCLAPLRTSGLGPQRSRARLRSIEAPDRFTAVCLRQPGPIEVIGKGTSTAIARLGTTARGPADARLPGGRRPPGDSPGLPARPAPGDLGDRGSDDRHPRAAAEVRGRAEEPQGPADGLTTQNALEQAVEDSVEHPGPARSRSDLASAHLGGIRCR